MTQQVIEQSVLITNAFLGTPEFEAFGWRNHAGINVDTQNFWWNGFAADAFGAEVADGAPALNFGRLNDPVINDLLERVRSETDPAARKELAQEINRQFARGVLDRADLPGGVGHPHGPQGPEHRPRAPDRR